MSRIVQTRAVGEAFAMARKYARDLSLLSIDDLATLFNVCTRTVVRWVDAGRLPKPLRFGRLLRWRLRDIESFIDPND